jgi:uncharacterized cupredoxin-like copper-binding protein
MFSSKRLGALIFATSLLLVVSACSGAGTESTATPGADAVESDFGSPAEAADAGRTVEISANDDFTFEPAEVSVAPGETVIFRVVNRGSLVHDFTLGDQATQDEHEAEMAEMEDMAHDEPNVMTLPAGETVELTWTFPESGTVLIGCHQPGHYDAGMKGEITIDG